MNDCSSLPRSAFALLALTFGTFGFPLFAQPTPDHLPHALLNGGMEEAGSDGVPTGWKLRTKGDGIVQLEPSKPFAGKGSARLDSTAAAETKEGLFTNLMQTIDAGDWKGKKVRFRAAVRTEALTDTSRVQMWFRVDRENGSPTDPKMGAFDNMQDRPIDSSEWKQYDIILPVDADAAKLNVGIFILGRGRAWIDDASLEVVADETAATGQPQMSPAVRQAFAEAENAPQQPFFTPWLCLAVLTIVLSVIAMLPETAPGEGYGAARKVAVRFTVIYWSLSCLPGLMVSLLPVAGAPLDRLFDGAGTWIVEWMARHVFGISKALVPPNGSGDTTYNYLLILAFFVISVVGAVLWSLLDRRTTSYATLREVFWSCLRYALAFVLLGYGLSKVTLEMNQFPENTAWQLDKTWGDSSPMNVLWAFMGASRAYTQFAGMAEIAAAVLLVFRRTAALGAVIALGTMTNVMLLNYCYDVPVKIFSTHLVVMSIMVLLPDARRLVNVFVLNRATEPAASGNTWQSPRLRRIHPVAKTAVVGLLFFLPLGIQAWKLSGQLTRRAAAHVEAGSKYRLTKRGFRWINEVPYNR